MVTKYSDSWMKNMVVVEILSSTVVCIVQLDYQ